MHGWGWAAEAGVSPVCSALPDPSNGMEGSSEQQWSLPSSSSLAVLPLATAFCLMVKKACILTLYLCGQEQSLAKLPQALEGSWGPGEGRFLLTV